jgi:hypothetical protein
LALSRLKQLGEGLVGYLQKHVAHGRPRLLVLEPLELLRKLVALIPPPRQHLVRYHGVFAPNARTRSAVVLDSGTAKEKGLSRPYTDEPMGAPVYGRVDWATLLRRTFAIDVLACPRCDGRMEVLACITDRQVAAQILRHTGLASVAAPLSARAPPGAGPDPPGQPGEERWVDPISTEDGIDADSHDEVHE